MTGNLSENDWNLLLMRIKDGQCTPFLGAGTCSGTIPLGGEIARAWAEQYNYPFEDCHDLMKVAQFLAVNYDCTYPKECICQMLKGIASPDFSVPDEPHSVLANLDLPLYITTNYDNFMFRALKHANKDPKQDFCRWNDRVEDEPSVFLKDPEYQPSKENPLVFHMHGHIGVKDSLVLTEEDYLDFLVNLLQAGLDREHARKILPHQIVKAIGGNTLLFVGYRMEDWNFKIIFRSLVTYSDKVGQKKHISVQLAPCAPDMDDSKKEQVVNFLNKSLSENKISIYWGTAREFVSELRQRLEAY